jgi:hypothetical protein
MKNHLYQDKKYIHLCEGTRILENNPDTYLVWTTCGIDVPANSSFVSDECITCPDCIADFKMRADFSPNGDTTTPQVSGTLPPSRFSRRWMPRFRKEGRNEAVRLFSGADQ